MLDTNGGPRQASIKKNYFYNTLLNVSNILIPLVTYPYVLRVIGPEGLGKVNFAVSIAGYFLIIAQFGIPLYGIKEIAKVRDDRDKLNSVFSELFLVNLIMSVLSILFYAGLMFGVARFRSDPVLYFVTGTMLAVNVFSIDWLYGGLEEYKYITLRSIAVRMLYIVLTFIVIRTGKDYIGYAALTVFMLLAANAVNMAMMPQRAGFDFSRVNLKKYLMPLFLVFLAGAIASIYNKLDVVMLGFLSNDGAVGYYTADRRVITLLLYVVVSLTTVLMPRLSYYLGKNMKDEYNKTAERSINFLYFASLPIIVTCLLLSDQMLLLLGGGKFLPAAFALKLLSVQILLSGLTNFFNTQVILAHNDEKSMMIATVAGAAVNVPINLLLIRSLAQNAPCIAILCSEAAVIAVQMFLTRKYMTFRLFKMQSLNYPLAALLMLAAAWYLKLLTKTAHFAVILAAVFLPSISVYFLLLLAIKDENAMIILKTIGNRLQPRGGKGRAKHG